MHNIPSISIITPSYNQSRFLENAILSLLDQDYTNLEYFILDAGSTDDSTDIIKKHKNHISFWSSEPDRGQSDAINKGWRRATGDIIAWLNADDWYASGALQRVGAIFAGNPDLIAVIGACATCDYTGAKHLFTTIPTHFDTYRMIETCGSVPTQPSVFLNRKVLDEVGYLNPDLHLVMDWEYWIRLGLTYDQSQFMLIDDVLSFNRDWEGTKTNNAGEAIANENLMVLDRIFKKYPHDDRLKSIHDSAYRACLRKRAEAFLFKGDRKSAFKDALAALRLGALSHNPLRDIVLLGYIMIGARRTRTIKARTTALRKLVTKNLAH